MVNDSSDFETDVLFLFDAGFSLQKIAESKNMPLSAVEKIVAKRGSAVRRNKQKNVIRDVANQNPWKDGVPERDVVMDVVRSVDTDNIDLESYGARTLPSKAIKRADRSDRIGEDFQLTDRIEAAVKADNDEKTEKAVYNELQKKRDEWTEVIAEVDELLENDKND